MKEIQELFDKLLDQQTKPKALLENYIKDEFKKLKIELNEDQLADIVIQIYPDPLERVSINITEEQLLIAGYDSEEDSQGDVKTIFDNLLNSISGKIKNLTETLPDLMIGSANDSADYMLNKILKEIPIYLAPQQYEHDQLIEGIDHAWGQALELFELFISMSLEFGERYSKENHIVSNENKYLYVALFRLHAKACQTSSEILTLLRTGFADGAHARWRSLHEISIISYFISEHGNELAKRYLDYETVENYKAAIQFQEYAEKLGQEKVADHDIEELFSSIQILDQKYGNEYKKGSYGWATSVINKTRPTFRDIEESIDLDHFRPYYKMASYNIHAGPKSLFYRLGLHETDTIMLAGPSNLGIAEPCRLTAISLSQITTNLVLNSDPNMDLIVASKMLQKLKEKIENAVFLAEKDLMSSGEKKV